MFLNVHIEQTRIGMKNKLGRILGFIILIGFISCNNNSIQDYQLVIVDASLFDSHTGQVDLNQTVFIQDGLIAKISKTRLTDITLNNALDAQGRLLSPAFIDVHNHLNFIFGDTLETTKQKDFLTFRKIISEQYIPYGVTVVRSAGGKESNIPMELSWMENHPEYIDYYPTGGALVSLDTKFYNHIYVSDSSKVISKIKEYYNSGIRHIKVYSLIGERELNSAIQTARKLDMNIFGHIENSMISIEKASELGLKNFEHAKTLFLEVVRTYEKNSRDLSDLPPDDNENWRYREYETFNFIGTDDPLVSELIEVLKQKKVSVTPTLHLYAHPIGLINSNMDIPIHEEKKLGWTGEKLKRAKMGYNELSTLVYELYKHGILLNTGSDTFEPGKAILSEMLLLNDLGIPMNEVLRIATINSARAINMEASYGSIEVGKKAHLILFDEDPMLNPVNLLSKKTIIKDGIVWAQH